MVKEEERVGDGELGVTHEELKIVMHCIMRILHAVLSIDTRSTDVILYKYVWLLVERIGELKMWKGLVIGVSQDWISWWY